VLINEGIWIHEFWIPIDERIILSESGNERKAAKDQDHFFHGFGIGMAKLSEELVVHQFKFLFNFADFDYAQSAASVTQIGLLSGAAH
jgi:hypothetical protein